MLQTYKGMAFKPYPPFPGTAVCLAGLEAREFMDVFIEMDIKSVLASFFYLRRKFKRTKEYIKQLKEEYQNFNYIFMDSGGFTLQQEKRRGKLKISLSDYIKQYKDFALEMQEHITVFGAIDSITDDYRLDDYINHLYDFKESGIHIAPTIWTNTPWKIISDYKLVEEFDIVGLSGARLGFKKTLNQFSKLKKSGVKIHGYAATREEHFSKLKFFSVDSISWLSAQRHALTFEFVNGKVRTKSPYTKMETRRHLLGQYANDYNIDVQAVIMENQLRKGNRSVSQEIYDEVNKLNLIAWSKLAEHQMKNSHRAYWHDSEINKEYSYID